MTTYAIGDIQGCYASLQTLLEKISFNPAKDRLWFVGDLVNRGPKSLEVLRFISTLKGAICTLGNHDLHLLGVYFGVRKSLKKDTLQEILKAPDSEQLMHWLLKQKLFHWDKELGYAIAHAGIHPSWNFEEAETYSLEISTALQNSDTSQVRLFLSQIFGDHPNHPDLLHPYSNSNLNSDSNADRARFIINCFTRMRVCTPQSALLLDYKGTYENRPESTEAWFKLRSWLPGERLIFGHWAALMGKAPEPHLFAVDTGCIWGNQLTALRLSDGARISVEAVEKA